MDKKKVIRYFLLYDAYMRDNNIKFNDEQFDLINEVNMYAKNDINFMNFINTLKGVGYYDRENIINEYYNNYNIEKKNTNVKVRVLKKDGFVNINIILIVLNFLSISIFTIMLYKVFIR